MYIVLKILYILYTHMYEFKSDMCVYLYVEIVSGSSCSSVVCIELVPVYIIYIL